MDGASRRRALTALALAAILADCAGAAERPPPADLPSGTPPGERVPEARVELPGIVVSGRHFVLDSEARATVSAPDSAAARAAIHAAFVVADSIEALLSVHRADSELARINAAAGKGPVPVSPWMEAILATALLWAERSGGAFEPTIGPVADLWGFGRSPVPRIPTEAELAEARQLVGWRKVIYDPAAHTVELTVPGMVLDLRGVAKGFALDRMREAMTAGGVMSGIVDLDDDVIFFGPAAGRRPDRWEIAFPDPFDPDSRYARFELPPGAVATSAALDRTTVIAGLRYGHLIDPRTGRPATGLASVTVYAADGVTSDILAKALSVLGPVDGSRLVERWPGIEAAFVTEPDPGARSAVVLTEGMEAWKVQVVPPYRPRRAEDDRSGPEDE